MEERGQARSQGAKGWTVDVCAAHGLELRGALDAAHDLPLPCSCNGNLQVSPVTETTCSVRIFLKVMVITD